MKSKYENMKIIYDRSKFGWYWAPLFIILWFLLFYLTVLPSFHHYPELLTVQDEINRPGNFIGERAEATLLKFTKIGPKIVGSAANEQVAVQFLLAEIDSIVNEARTDLYDIEKDVQIASGNYLLWSMVNVYQSIQNVVVKVMPKNTNSNATLLINSHYDTVPGSVGAGDAGIMCVIMLEVLRVITKYETPLTHAIVFLFNGAEENPLQGSHAFITQHEWAANVRAVINLDSAGSGSREILFQSGPDHPWLMKYYGANIVHPFASTIGEELFQNGFVPSETDFRIFRDFGHIPGLDMAHTFNGYVYHTKYDRFNLLPRRTYQLTGENILAIVKSLANAPEMANPKKYAEGHMIFFDVLGWFLIYYTEGMGYFINITVCILACITIIAYIGIMSHHTGMFRRRIFAKFGVLTAIQMCSVIFSFGLVICICLFMDSIGLSMSWYSQRWIIFGLYCCPMFFGLGIFPAIYFSRTKEHGLPLGYAIQLLMHSHCLILTVITAIMIAFNIRSAFATIFCIGFYTISVLINMTSCAHTTNFLWLISHCICQIMPFLHYTYCTYAFYIIFIPMQGRDGNSNPDIFIGGFTAILCLLFSPYLIPLLCLFRKSKTIISLFGACVVLFIVFAATPIGFPYAEKTAPQRFHVVHTARTFHNGDEQMSVNRTDAGFYVLPVDRHPNTLDNILFKNTNLVKASKDDCQTEIMCGYPIYSSRWLSAINNSYWIAGPPPNINNLPQISVISKQSTSLTNVVYTLEVSGPDHISIFIEPLAHVKLIDWSFIREPIEQNMQPPFYVYWSYALDPTPLRFNLEFERGSANWTDVTFKIALMGHRIHDDMYINADFRDFLSKFPAWAHASSWISSYTSWQI